MIATCFDGIVQRLSVSFAISAFEIKKLRIAEEHGYIRVRCSLDNGELLEFSEYVEIVTERVQIQSDSYHWQTVTGTLVRRWDNVAHHPELPSYPHHVHRSDGSAATSSPTTLRQVLHEIETRLVQSQN